MGWTEERRAAASAEHWFGRFRGVRAPFVEMKRGVELLDSDRVEEGEELEEQGEGEEEHLAMMSRSNLQLRTPPPVKHEDIGGSRRRKKRRNGTNFWEKSPAEASKSQLDEDNMRFSIMNL